ncbi:hypothetical protein PUN28_015526 [Cardiocondyla obscurior]
MKILLSIFYAILLCDQIANGYRILGVFPLHGKSHWIVNEALMKDLARRGHQVDVITHFPQKKPIPNYKDISLKDTLPPTVNNISAADLERFGGSPKIPVLVQMGGDVICNLLGHPKLQELIKNPPQDPPYDLVILELFASPCYIAFGRHLKVPVIATVTSMMHDWLNEVSANPINPAYTPSMFSDYTQRMNFKERLMNFWAIHFHTWQFHYYTNHHLTFVKKHFGIDVSNIKDLYKDIALYLTNSHHSLNGVRPLATNVIEVGGLHIRDDGPLSPEVQKWLDDSEHGCIYFTFGSSVRIETYPEKIIQQIYASFEKIAPVRVLMKVAKEEDLLPGLPKNVMTQPWFPQISIFKHKNTRAFITHGGLGGTTEAVYYGVPMIGIPLFADQHINVKNYVTKQVAISLHSIYNITEEKLTSALNSILKDPTYR